MPDGEWAESKGREEYVSDSGIIGYRGPNTKGKKFYNHMSAAKIKAEIGDEIWNSYFKFTVVRNPFSKLVSAWYFGYKAHVTLLKSTLGCLRTPNSLSLILANKRDIHDFRTWVRTAAVSVDRDKYLLNGEVCVDHFIRYEALDAGIKEVVERTGAKQEGREVPRHKVGVRSKDFEIHEFYDQRTEKIVRELYDWEFDRFKYEMPQG